mmetsp:Transcript_5124/g.7518  ORF Transcript_5124/g.7518 Transcript_5124/m.7518 type:complete len:109 (+) Transcript_5124:167-493(+)
MSKAVIKKADDFQRSRNNVGPVVGLAFFSLMLLVGVNGDAQYCQGGDSQCPENYSCVDSYCSKVASWEMIIILVCVLAGVTLIGGIVAFCYRDKIKTMAKQFFREYLL